MSDELSIQQQNQVSKTPYAVGGAVVGGAAAGIGTHLWAEPKYGSYEDIIKEASDADEFKKKIDAAEGEEKTFFEEAKSIADAKKEAETKYENELNNYIEQHSKEITPELDPNSTEAKNLKAAQDALKAKKDKALSEEIARITKEENARVVDQQKLADITAQANEIANAISRRGEAVAHSYENVNNYIANATPERVTEIESELTRHAKEVKKLERYEQMLLHPTRMTEAVNDSIITNVDNKGRQTVRTISFAKDITEADRTNLLEYVRQAKSSAGRVHDANLRNISGGLFNFNGISPEERHSLAEQVKTAMMDTMSMNENKEALTKGIKKKAGEFETAQREVIDAYLQRFKNEPLQRGRDGKVISNRFKLNANGDIWKLTQQLVDTNDKKEIERLTKNINTLKFAETVQKLNKYSLQEGSTIIKGNGTNKLEDIFAKVVNGDFNFEATSTKTKLSIAEQEEVRQLQAELKEKVAKVKEDIKANFTRDGKKAVPTDKEVEAKFLEALKSAEGEKDIASRIAALEGEIKPIKDALTKRQELGAKWRNLHLELESVLGKGYRLEKDAAGNVTKIFLADGKEFTADSALKFAGKVATPEGKYTAQEFRKLQELFASDKNVEKLTPEQIKAKAQEIVDKKVFKAEQDAVNDAKKAADAAKAKLPKTPAMTKEAATKAFNEARNVAGKEEFVNNEVKTKREEFTKKFEKELEGKLGKNAGWKLAGIVAGGAIICGLIGSALAPKNKA